MQTPGQAAQGYVSRHPQRLQRRRHRVGEEYGVNPLHDVAGDFEEIPFVFQRDQCLACTAIRQPALYSQDKAIYDKGRLNPVNLSDEEQIDADDNYRICFRRGSTEEAKPKRQRRKTQDDEDETEE